MNRSDQELISACVAGQTDAFDGLVLRYQDRLFNALLQILHSREETQDVVQEAFVVAWRKLDSFRGEAQFYSWLFRVAYNVAMTKKRKKQIPTVSASPLQSDGIVAQPRTEQASPSQRMELSEQQQTVQQALAALPEDYRVVLVLKEIESFKYEQIAEILDVPLGTIRSRIHRARQLLRQSLLRLLPNADELSQIEQST